MSEEDDVAPTQVQAEEYIAKFIEITASNSAVALEFLQDNHWKVELAVPAFYEALMKEEDDDVVEIPAPTPPVSAARLFGDGKEMTSEPPPRLQLLSWNLDGLDANVLKKRMSAVVGVVRRLEPDVIFFQEVIDESAAYLERKLPEYKFQRGNGGLHDGYYNVTLTRVFTVQYDSHSVITYNNTRMGRHYVMTRAHVGGRHFAFLNTHLESGKEFGGERVEQLRTAVSTGHSLPKEVTVVVGGDLNLRDGEVAPARIPGGWVDAWETCGSRADLRWTWDTRRNTNKGFGPNGPRARFDRIYVRAEEQRVRVEDFGLVGAQRATGTQMFPSDHWGVFVFFQLKHSSS